VKPKYRAKYNAKEKDAMTELKRERLQPAAYRDWLPKRRNEERGDRKMRESIARIYRENGIELVRRGSRESSEAKGRTRAGRRPGRGWTAGRFRFGCRLADGGERRTAGGGPDGGVGRTEV
jgi:hypothetical protein